MDAPTAAAYCRGDKNPDHDKAVHIKAGAELADRREIDRFMLWCLNERSKALSDVRVEDCRAYMAFLAGVPTA